MNRYRILCTAGLMLIGEVVAAGAPMDVTEMMRRTVLTQNEAYDMLPPADATVQAARLSLRVRKTMMAAKEAQTKQDVGLLWLVSVARSEKPRALVCGACVNGELLPRGEAIVSQSQGTAWTVRLLKRSKQVCQAQAAQRAVLFENAKQLGVAILLYAQDHGEALPTGDDIKSKLSRYVKNQDLFNGFVYTYRGGKTDDIFSPIDTQLGYVQGAGERAVIYADGHVAWKSDGTGILSPSPEPGPRTRLYATDNPHKSFLDRAVQDAVDSYVRHYRPIGFSISILYNGRASYYNYGETKAGTGVLPTSRTIYEIGSITKTMTGILLAHAVLDRKLNLDDDIRRHLSGSYPNLQYAGKPILLKHLATHTSGLPHDGPSIPEDPNADDVSRYSHARLLSDLASIRLVREPGTEFGYSNMGAGLVGLALERAYGLPYEQLLKTYIFGPANMKHSGIALTPDMDRNYATPYDASGAQTERWSVNGTEAAGAVRSNAEDMLGYARLNLNEKDPAVALSHKLLSSPGRLHHGLFWVRSDSSFWGPNFSHEGGTGGFSTVIIVAPSKKFAVVILMNKDDQPAGQLSDMIARRILHVWKK